MLASSCVETSRTSMMELFCENHLLFLIFSQEISIRDVWLGSKYSSEFEYHFKNLKIVLLCIQKYRLSESLVVYTKIQKVFSLMLVKGTTKF